MEASLYPIRAMDQFLQVVRNKTWNQLLNVCTLMHLALPVLEVQQCLPCMGPQKALLMTDSLSEGEGGEQASPLG